MRAYVRHREWETDTLRQTNKRLWERIKDDSKESLFMVKRSTQIFL